MKPSPRLSQNSDFQSETSKSIITQLNNNNNGLQNPTFVSSVMGASQHPDHTINCHNSQITENNHLSNITHNPQIAYNPFVRERIESRLSQTASRHELSMEHYQNLE